MHADPESVKVQLSHQYLFTLLGSAHVKTVLKMLMKLPPAAVAWCQHSQVFVRLFHRSEKERGRKREREREGEKGERWEGERGREREGKRGKERGREREREREGERRPELSLPLICLYFMLSKPPLHWCNTMG